jgi:hypothetical protein
VPYHSYLSTQFRTAYDVYLELCRRVARKIDQALGHDTPNWRLRNCCPPCFYKLEDEPKLEFSCFISIDGNNSLKRLGETVRNQTARLDSHTLESDRWLSAEEVDVFKDEVKSSLVCLFIWLHAYCITNLLNSPPKGRTTTSTLMIMKTTTTPVQPTLTNV